MSQKQRKRRSSELEIELNGYETASSGTDFSDFYYPADNDEDISYDENHALQLINITESPYDVEFSDIKIPDSEDPFAQTELVLKFHPSIHPDALKWFITRVTSKKSRGGAELLLRREPFMGMKKEGLVVHVTAAGWRQLEVAEMLEIKKMDYSREIPIPREFKVREIHRFLKDNMKIHELLTPAEKQMAVMHELKGLLSLPGEKYVPGYTHLKLTRGLSLFHVFTAHNLIASYFALHQEHNLKLVEGKWFWDFFLPQPYEDVRSYFGDAICLYFNFLAYYNSCITILAIFGLITYLLPDFNFTVVFFCICNLLIVNGFLIYWLRYCYRLAFMWGTLRMNTWEEPRANYSGVLSLDPVTGRVQKKYPYYKTACKLLASFAAVVCCIAFAILLQHWYLVWDENLQGPMAKSHNKKPKAATFVAIKKSDKELGFWAVWAQWILPYIPGLGYGIIVWIVNKFYRRFASILTEWENHRTQTQFERHLVIKMVVFEVTNNFGILFYTAFILRNEELLQSRLLTMLLTSQLLITADTCIRPLLFRSGTAKMNEFLDRRPFEMFRIDKFGNIVNDSSSAFVSRQFEQPYPALNEFDLEIIDNDDPRVEMSKVEGKMDPYNYEADFDDYLQLLLQFGYVFLFSSVFPLGACCAWICNVILLYTSLFKLREVYQRPLAVRVSSIGAAWQVAFEAMGIAVVMINCALLGVNPELRKLLPRFSDSEWIILFVFIEHVILILVYLVRKLIPKLPYKVQVTLAAYEYRSREAFKREEAQKTRRRMTQVFRPINENLAENPAFHQLKNSPAMQMQQQREPAQNPKRNIKNDNVINLPKKRQ